MEVEALIGEVRMFAGDKAPSARWSICDGKLLKITEYQSLFALIGTTYGGDGVATFAVPQLKKIIPVQAGNKSPGVPVEYGQTVGSDEVTINSSNVPFHNHTMKASPSDGLFTKSENLLLANTGLQQAYSPKPQESLRGIMAPNTLAETGANETFLIIQPYLQINYIIALEGIFPQA